VAGLAGLAALGKERTMNRVNGKLLAGVLGVFAVFAASGAFSAEAVAGASFMDMAKESGFMEYILLLTSITGVALFLQALVTIRAHLLRPPELAAELMQLVEEGNLDEAVDAAQADTSFLGAVAFATLSKANYGKESMESSMADAGEIEASKYLTKIGVLQLIAAVAPMLGLTGTTIGMIMTFAIIAVKADAVSAPDMARGISIALVCTFTGLMIAIPLLVGSFFLKARLMQTIYEISNDCNEMIRTVTSGEKQ
jgi:biopolymer transport protein ExbB